MFGYQSSEEANIHNDNFSDWTIIKGNQSYKANTLCSFDTQNERKKWTYLTTKQNKNSITTAMFDQIFFLLRTQFSLFVKTDFSWL